MNIITSTKDLADVCRRLATHDFVAVDTEFLRETTFWPKLCVIQIASMEEAVIVDALADDLDLEPQMAAWSEAQLRAFFDSGGEVRPAAVFAAL